MRLIFASLLFAGALAHADVPPLDVPAVDTPYNFAPRMWTYPSMRQSLAVSTDFYEQVHAAIGGNPPKEGAWRPWSIVAVDAITNWTPIGSAWLHEEWHRAVLSRHGMSSYNDTYNFPIFSDLIYVSHVT